MHPTQTSVAELMSRKVVTIRPTARVQDVLALAHDRGVHHFPIVEDTKLVGFVCTCDLEDLAPDQGVLQVAWRHVVTMPAGSPLSDAAQLMATQGVGSIVVTSDLGICGIVTRNDLVRADPELDKLLMEARCAACATRSHLRPGPAGQCLCQSCHARAKDGADLELGGDG